MSYAVNHIAHLIVTLDDISPVVWRRIEVPLTASLRAIHDVIQATMLFEGRHQFEFSIGTGDNESRYGIPDPDGLSSEIMDARKVKLDRFIEEGVKSFSYTYDFGDDWHHTIVIEAVMVENPLLEYPRFVDGANRAPPEDVGGQPGFEHFLIVMANPAHPEHSDIKRWHGGKFDPGNISETEITTRIGKLARRRTQARAAAAKSRNKLN